ncbi:MAG: helix-turn-helix domain-containing protein [Pseudomonadota bacterium]
MSAEIHIHLATGFPALSLMLVTEPLRVANLALGETAFTWRLVADRAGAVVSSGGFDVRTEGVYDLADAPLPAAAILLLSDHAMEAATGRTMARFRMLDSAGVLVGSVERGALVFARAGLLRQRPAAAHPEAIADYRRQFPGSLFTDRLHDFAPPRFSSAGGVATMTMTLALIAHFRGARLAARVAEILTFEDAPALRPAVEAAAARCVEPGLADALSLMRRHLADPLPVSEIAMRASLSVSRMRRLFQRHLRTSPTSYYVGLRLERARGMLRNSSLTVGEIAGATGYESLEVFSRAYTKHFGTAPSRDRAL